MSGNVSRKITEEISARAKARVISVRGLLREGKRVAINRAMTRNIAGAR
jgi:hypothetical protein